MKLLENLIISTPNIDFLYQIIVQSWFASMTSFGPKRDKVESDKFGKKFLNGTALASTRTYFTFAVPFMV
jgi:hypothetical protein